MRHQSNISKNHGALNHLNGRACRNSLHISISQSIQPLIPGHLYFVDINQGDFGETSFSTQCAWISLDELIEQEPLSVQVVCHFLHSLRTTLFSLSLKTIALYVDSSKRNPQEYLFLVGCYLIKILGWNPEMLKSKIACAEVPFESVPCLSLLDMWSGYHRAEQIGWTHEVKVGKYCSECSRTKHCFGVYLPFAHVIIPGELATFMSAVDDQNAAVFADFEQREEELNADTEKTNTLIQMGVASVVSLLSSQREDEAIQQLPRIELPFASRGGRLPPDLVSAFRHLFRASGRGRCDAAGLVAVDRFDGAEGRACDSLCGLLLMERHGFGAAEAAAWLRLFSIAADTAPRDLSSGVLAYLRLVEQELQEHLRGRVDPGPSLCETFGATTPTQRTAAMSRAVYRVWARAARRPPGISQDRGAGAGTDSKAAARVRVRPQSSYALSTCPEPGPGEEVADSDWEAAATAASRSCSEGAYASGARADPPGAGSLGCLDADCGGIEAALAGRNRALAAGPGPRPATTSTRRTAAAGYGRHSKARTQPPPNEVSMAPSAGPTHGPPVPGQAGGPAGSDSGARAPGRRGVGEAGGGGGGGLPLRLALGLSRLCVPWGNDSCVWPWGGLGAALPDPVTVGASSRSD